MVKNIRKRLAMALVAAMLVTNIPQVVFASDYTNHWASTAIAKWEQKGILTGYEDGSFRPKATINRAEFAQILVRVFGYTDITEAKTYTDVAEDKWYAEAIELVSSAGVMHEEGNTFRPTDAITREEAAYALAQAYKVSGSTDKVLKDEAAISEWAEQSVEAMFANGYINGTPEGNFNPKGTLTRAELVTMIDNMTTEVINVAGTYTQNVEGNLIVNTRDVVLKDMTIKGNLYLAEGIGDGDIDLDGITVEGRVFVEGGGINSIKSKNSKYYESIVVSANNPVRVVMDGDAVKVEALPGVEVTLTGNFKEVIVAPDVNMMIKDATVNNIIVAPANDGTTDKAKAPTINIDKSAKVENIKADSAVEIKGEGKVDNLVVNAGDVKIEQTPGKVEIKDKDTTVNIGGQDKDQSQVNKPSTGGGGGSSSGGNDNNGGSTTPAEKYRLSGKVTFQGEPVEYARVNVFDDSIVDGDNFVTGIETDKDGNFSFYVKSGKTYWIEAWITDEDGNGYHISKTDINMNQDYTGITLELEQKYVANFNVVDKNGVAMSDIMVRPVVDGKENGWSYTDNYGFAQRYLWDWDWNQEALFGFNFYTDESNSQLVYSMPEELSYEKDKYTQEFDVVLAQYGLDQEITGYVKKLDGTPAKNTSIELYEREIKHAYGWSSRRVAETTTDEEGKYTFKVPDNKKVYHVEVHSRDTQGNTWVTDTVEARFVHEQDAIIRQAYGIDFEVVDKNNMPIRDAEIRVYHNNGDSGTNTGSNGKASIYRPSMEPGTYLIEVTVGEGENAKVQVRQITMTEGTYNYSEKFKFDNVETNNRLAIIEVIGDYVTVGNREIRVAEVGVQGENWGQWTKVENGKAVITIPEEYADNEVRIIVAGPNGERLYHEGNISFTENTLEKKLDLRNLPKYTVDGQVALMTTEGMIQVTTGAMISVEVGTWDGERINIGNHVSDEIGFTQDNLVGADYYFVATYTDENDQQYMCTEHIDVYNNRNSFVMELLPVVKVNVTVVDADTNETLSDVPLELGYSKREGYV